MFGSASNDDNDNNNNNGNNSNDENNKDTLFESSDLGFTKQSSSAHLKKETAVESGIKPSAHL